MNAAPIYDLILQGGHVICPASGIDGVMDVAIAGGKIALVGKDILPSTAQQVINIRGKLVLPGMIERACRFSFQISRFWHSCRDW